MSLMRIHRSKYQTGRKSRLKRSFSKIRKLTPQDPKKKKRIIHSPKRRSYFGGTGFSAVDRKSVKAFTRMPKGVI